jgi:hypothetical protein
MSAHFLIIFLLIIGLGLSAAFQPVCARKAHSGGNTMEVETKCMPCFPMATATARIYAHSAALGTIPGDGSGKDAAEDDEEKPTTIAATAAAPVPAPADIDDSNSNGDEDEEALYNFSQTSVAVLRKRFGSRKTLWGEWSNEETRAFYKQQLPRSLLEDGALSLTLKERAQLAAEARHALRLYVFCYAIALPFFSCL